MVKCSKCGKTVAEIKEEYNLKSVWIWTHNGRLLCDFCIIDETEAQGYPLPKGLHEINDMRKSNDAARAAKSAADSAAYEAAEALYGEVGRINDKLSNE